VFLAYYFFSEHYFKPIFKKFGIGIKIFWVSTGFSSDPYLGTCRHLNIFGKLWARFVCLFLSISLLLDPDPGELNP
jgi:hypothetical protein